MQAEQLNSFWHCAQTNNPVLSYEQFREIPVDSRQAMLAAGLLKEGQPSRSVECDGCEDGHVEEVRQVEYPDGKRRFFISCPECSCVEVKPERLRQWVFDYGKIIDLLYKNLNCRGKSQAIIARTFWHVGAAALAGQSRPVWLARTITPMTKELMPTGKLPILFKIFPGQYQVDNFDSDRMFELCELIFIKDGELKLDVDTIKNQMGYVIETQTPVPQPPRKDANRAAVIKAAKKELHQHILSMKSFLASGNPKLPHLTQKQLAKQINASETMVSNILAKEPDELLRILWQTANDPDKIRKYSRKQG